MDYVEKFIEFLENYKENGKKKYVEKIKKLKKSEKSILTVELADVYKYNRTLGIKLINDVLSGNEELIPKILERLSALLSVLNPSIDEIGLLIPRNIKLIGYMEEALGRTFNVIGYVAFVDGKRIGILQPPEDVDDELKILIATLNIDILISAGDKISAFGRWTKEGFVIDSMEVIEKNEEQIESRVNIKNLLSLYSLPEDYPIRLIKFLEKFKDKDGRYKYKEMIDEMIEKGEEEEINLSVYDLLSFDKDLGKLALENPDYVLPIYMTVVNFYAQMRFALKKGLIPGAELKDEKVILTQDFIRATNTRYNMSEEEIADLIGGKLENGKIIVKFGIFVAFMVIYGWPLINGKTFFKDA